MKKSLLLIAMIIFSATLFSCKKELKEKVPTVTISSTTCYRKEVALVGLASGTEGTLSEKSFVAKIYKDGEEVGLDTYTFAENEDYGVLTTDAREEEISFEFSDLTAGTDYTIKITGTYNKKETVLYKANVSTISIGTSDNPYKISKPEDFENIQNDYGSDVYYELSNDIDFANYGLFTPLRGTTSGTGGFCGHFDGKGYTIKNVTIDTTTLGACGFFGYNSGEIKNVNFDSVTVKTTRTSSNTVYAGVIAFNAGTLDNVKADKIEITASAGTVYIGGFVGSNVKGNIKNCSSTQTVVKVDSATTKVYCGGFIGYNSSNGTENAGVITSSYTNGVIEIINARTASVGGFIGEDAETSEINTSLTNCYSNYTIRVGSSGLTNIGGFVGISKATITNCYALGTITYRSYKIVDETETEVSLTNDLSIGGLIGSAAGIIVSELYSDVDINVTANIVSKTAYLGGIFGKSDGCRITKSFSLGNIDADVSGTSYTVKTSAFDGSKTCYLVDVYYYNGITITVNELEETTDSYNDDLTRSIKYESNAILISDYNANPSNYPNAVLTPYKENYYLVKEKDNIYLLTKVEDNKYTVTVTSPITISTANGFYEIVQ